jgi:AhpD family alkylhydroperoxidase
MKSRMSNAVMVLPEAMKAMQALGAASQDAGLPARTIDLVQLRASQINGCGVCVDMHAKIGKQHGETDERLFAVAAWREAPYFSDAERAALALTEALTRISDRPEPVSDAIWAEAARHYSDTALSALIVAIANINVWNRLNVAVRQPVGSWKV